MAWELQPIEDQRNSAESRGGAWHLEWCRVQRCLQTNHNGGCRSRRALWAAPWDLNLTRGRERLKDLEPGDNKSDVHTDDAKDRWERTSQEPQSKRSSQYHRQNVKTQAKGWHWRLGGKKSLEIWKLGCEALESICFQK